MSINIRIKWAELTRNTELFGRMGTEIKRSILGKGRKPMFEDSFMVPLNTPALEFSVIDKEGGCFKKMDDFIGSGTWNCAEISTKGGQPFETFIPLNYKDTNIGKLFIEVYLAGTAGYGVGGVGSNGMAGGYGLMTAGIGFYSPDVSGGYQTMGGGYQTMGGYPQKNRGFIQPGRSF